MRNRTSIAAWRSLVAAGVVCTCYVVFWSARQVQMDLLLAACTCAAIVPAAAMIERRLAPVAGWTAIGIASGLGFLAKGPLGVICPALAIVPFVALSNATSAGL